MWSVIQGLIPCITVWNRPADKLRVSWEWLKWDGSDWGVCAYSSWEYNTGVVNSVEDYYDFGSSPWCGSGNYGNFGNGWLKDLSDDWQGGSLWSESHDSL